MGMHLGVRNAGTILVEPGPLLIVNRRRYQIVFLLPREDQLPMLITL